MVDESSLPGNVLSGPPTGEQSSPPLSLEHVLLLEPTSVGKRGKSLDQCLNSPPGGAL